jgi:hypothetical protein
MNYLSISFGEHNNNGKEGKTFEYLRKYHIYRISKDNLHMSDTYNDIYNPHVWCVT